MTGLADRIDEVAVAALQAVLGTVHAALWCHRLAVAFLPPELAQRSRADTTEHIAQRAALEQTLADLGTSAVSAEPAYALTEPVTDTGSAARLLVLAETDPLGAWRAVLERTEDSALRGAALTALTEATLRCARWRATAGQDPAVPQFPGL